MTTPPSKCLGVGGAVSVVLSAEERAEIPQSIADEGIDLANVVDDLLVHARAEPGTLTVSCVPVDLGAQTAEVAQSLHRSMTGTIELAEQSVRALWRPCLRGAADHLMKAKLDGYER